ncbi:MAG: Gfo/Idh/MocA family oxidoreductase, partial [Bacteroidota bacterium]
VEAVDIVTPTLAHYDCACRALDAGKHIFIEKPLTNTLGEAEELLARATELGVIAQVGHVERFNPAFLALDATEMNPMFIEGHRLAQYNPRGTDVSVVLDLMIHDLDVVLSVVPSPIKEISASGVVVVSESPDIANARLEFENGCVANLTASRISIKNMRRLRIFQKNAYLAVDFLKKQTERIQLVENDGGETEPGKMKFEINTGKEVKHIVFEMPPVPEVNSIKLELEEFAASITNGAPVRVPISAGYRALQTAHLILEKIEERMQVA